LETSATDILLDLANVFDRQAQTHGYDQIDDMPQEELQQNYSAGIAMGFNMARMLTIATLQELHSEK
jgi:hypothetical protein